MSMAYHPSRWRQGVVLAALSLLLLAWQWSAGAAEPAALESVPLEIDADGERHWLEVELARTSAERQKGLMDRDHLAPDAGMLFLYDEAQPPEGASGCTAPASRSISPSSTPRGASRPRPPCSLALRQPPRLPDHPGRGNLSCRAGSERRLLRGARHRGRGLRELAGPGGRLPDRLSGCRLSCESESRSAPPRR